MATKDYFVEYNFATNEGHFETPQEYEKRIMVDVPPAHKFLKKIGITQKVYDKVESIYKSSKEAIDGYKKQYGNEWYKKSSPKNDLFTDGHDKILEATCQPTIQARIPEINMPKSPALAQLFSCLVYEYFIGPISQVNSSFSEIPFFFACSTCKDISSLKIQLR